MKTIRVYDITGVRAVLDSDGDIIFSMIVDEFSKGEDVTLDFIKVNTVLSMFMNSAIAQLYGKYTSQYLNEHLTIANMSLDDKITLKRVNDRAKQFYAEKKDMQQFLEEDVFNE